MKLRRLPLALPSHHRSRCDRRERTLVRINNDCDDHDALLKTCESRARHSFFAMALGRSRRNRKIPPQDAFGWKAFENCCLSRLFSRFAASFLGARSERSIVAVAHAAFHSLATAHESSTDDETRREACRELVE